VPTSRPTPNMPARNQSESELLHDHRPVSPKVHGSSSQNRAGCARLACLAHDSIASPSPHKLVTGSRVRKACERPRFLCDIR
jgi:hypothetical protein